MNSQLFGLILTITMVAPLLIPLLLASFWVNLKSIQLLKKERMRSGPSTIRRGSRKLFVIYPSNRD